MCCMWVIWCSCCGVRFDVCFFVWTAATCQINFETMNQEMMNFLHSVRRMLIHIFKVKVIQFNLSFCGLNDVLKMVGIVVTFDYIPGNHWICRCH